MSNKTQQEGRELVKEYGRKSSGWKGVKYRLMGLVGRDIPVEYRSPADRCSFEKECLQLWADRGLKVPAVVHARDNRLVIEHVSGPTLQELLESTEVPLVDKLDAVSEIYAEMRGRHCYAIYENNHRLIHFDSNLRNTVLTPEGPVLIDFEMGRLDEKIDRSAAREVKKLTLEVLNLLGQEQEKAILDRLVQDYGIRHVLRRMADEELDRPMFKYHSQRDEKRKQAQPSLITKLDLAVGLRERVGTAREERKGAVQGGGDLKQAEGSSWDGKFYQSLDDRDTRGRDMPHRYAVMEFPKDLTGQSVLDIGCNLGRICIDAVRRGASRSVGIDFRQDVMDAMNTYSKNKGIGAEFFGFDVNEGAEALEKVIGSEKFDVVCALAVWSHVEHDKLWEIVNATCAKEFYFEDNAPSRVKCLDEVERILRDKLDFERIEFMGFTTDRGVRAVYRMQR